MALKSDCIPHKTMNMIIEPCDIKKMAMSVGSIILFTHHLSKKTQPIEYAEKR